MKNGRDPERTRGRILEAAMTEFAHHGLGGARVDRIAERAGANKRMLYYYYGSKEALFLAVLEQSYAQIRHAERELDLEHIDPVQLYISIAGEGYFYLSNRYTLSRIFDRDLMAPRALAARAGHITEMVLNAV